MSSVLILQWFSPRLVFSTVLIFIPPASLAGSSPYLRRACARLRLMPASRRVAWLLERGSVRTTIRGILHYKALADCRARAGWQAPCPAGRQGGGRTGGQTNGVQFTPVGDVWKTGRMGAMHQRVGSQGVSDRRHLY